MNLQERAPEPGEYMVSADVWVETERLTDGSLVFNVWMRSDAPRAKGRGDERVRFALAGESGEDAWTTWTRACALAHELSRLTSAFCGWGVY